MFQGMWESGSGGGGGGGGGIDLWTGFSHSIIIMKRT